MRILVHGRFHPSIGGIETIVNLLAREWAATGHEIVVVSNLPGDREPRRIFPFRVIYTPGPREWFRLVKWSEAVLHMNLSLKAHWPHLVLRRPLIVSHQSFYTSYRSCKSLWRERLKLRLMSRATNIASSHAISSSLGIRCSIIPNPYDCALFNQTQSVPRDGDLLFVGRLVSEKGVDLLLTAIKHLEPPWMTMRLTIIGDGPERALLQKRAAALGLSQRIHFLGALGQSLVADEMRRHKVLVIPSVYEEPFGVVALEGSACGCMVLGSDGGGLPEAIGPAGITFRRGDPADLTSKLMSLFRAAPESKAQRRAFQDHLESHHPRRIASEYMKIFCHLQLHPRRAELLEAPSNEAFGGKAL
jgi:glycosyltransferase involved in cell wall biosynthesis